GHADGRSPRLPIREPRALWSAELAHLAGAGPRTPGRLRLATIIPRGAASLHLIDVSAQRVPGRRIPIAPRRARRRGKHEHTGLLDALVLQAIGETRPPEELLRGALADERHHTRLKARDLGAHAFRVKVTRLEDVIISHALGCHAGQPDLVLQQRAELWRVQTARREARFIQDVPEAVARPGVRRAD